MKNFNRLVEETYANMNIHEGNMPKEVIENLETYKSEVMEVTKYLKKLKIFKPVNITSFDEDEGIFFEMVGNSEIAKINVKLLSMYDELYYAVESVGIGGSLEQSRFESEEYYLDGIKSFIERVI